MTDTSTDSNLDTRIGTWQDYLLATSFGSEARADETVVSNWFGGSSRYAGADPSPARPDAADAQLPGFPGHTDPMATESPSRCRHDLGSSTGVTAGCIKAGSPRTWSRLNPCARGLRMKRLLLSLMILRPACDALADAGKFDHDLDHDRRRSLAEPPAT